MNYHNTAMQQLQIFPHYMENHHGKRMDMEDLISVQGSLDAETHYFHNLMQKQVALPGMGIAQPFLLMLHMDTSFLLVMLVEVCPTKTARHMKRYNAGKEQARCYDTSD